MRVASAVCSRGIKVEFEGCVYTVSGDGSLVCRLQMQYTSNPPPRGCFIHSRATRVYPSVISPPPTPILPRASQPSYIHPPPPSLPLASGTPPRPPPPARWCSATRAAARSGPPRGTAAPAGQGTNTRAYVYTLTLRTWLVGCWDWLFFEFCGEGKGEIVIFFVVW
jgi:hypothetical protein